MAGINDAVRMANAKGSKIHPEDVTNLLDAVVELCKKGEDVIIKGFGTFSKVHKEARSGRNPSTGETIQIAAKDVFHFKASKQVDMTVPVASNRRR